MSHLSSIILRRLPGKIRQSTNLLCRRSLGSNTNDEEKKIKFSHFILLICPITAFSLGYWQIQRRKWKIDLIEKITKILPLPPIPLPLDAKASTDLLELQPVKVEGQFDHSREVIVGPRNIITDDIEFGGYGSGWGSKPAVSGGNARKESNLSNFGAPSASGYCVVTPFELKDRPGTFILVNRGWVPTSNRDPFLRQKGQIEGLVTINGYIRYNEKPPPFTPDPKLMSCMGEKQTPQKQYFVREVLRISEYLGTLPIFIDANYESSVVGGPVGGQIKVQIRNEHLQYVLTWFSLGTITLGMWVYWLFF